MNASGDGKTTVTTMQRKKEAGVRNRTEERPQ